MILGVLDGKTGIATAGKRIQSETGLASGIWTRDLSRAHKMASEIKAGVVQVYTYGGADNTVPLGGFKQSGNGQDKSQNAFDKFINKKTTWIKL